MVVQCCACGKIRKGNMWRDPYFRELAGMEISHGYCPVCALRALIEVESSFEESSKHPTLLQSRHDTPPISD